MGGRVNNQDFGRAAPVTLFAPDRPTFQMRIMKRKHMEQFLKTKFDYNIVSVILSFVVLLHTSLHFRISVVLAHESRFPIGCL